MLCSIRAIASLVVWQGRMQASLALHLLGVGLKLINLLERLTDPCHKFCSGLKFCDFDLLTFVWQSFQIAAIFIKFKINV